MDCLVERVAHRFLAKEPENEYSAGCLFYCPDDDTLLLTKRSGIMRHPHQWDIPGGRSEKTDKNHEATAHREAREELSCLPDDFTLLDKYKETFQREGKPYHYYLFLYSVSAKDKLRWTPKIALDEENSGMGWFKLDEIPKGKFHFDLSWVPKAVAKVEKESKSASSSSIRLSSESFKPRYERKYWVQSSQLPEIRAFLEPYVSVDEHGRDYAIHNIYFDNDVLQCFRDHVSRKATHFKLRARTYDSGDPVFLEVKSKTGGICSKQRSVVPSRFYTKVLRTALILDAVPFLQLASEYHSHPILRLDYDREAYNAHEASGRITFDTNVRYARQLEPVFEGAPSRTLFAPSRAILELKYSGEMPNFMGRLIQEFGLTPTSISKYCLGVGQLVRARELTVQVA